MDISLIKVPYTVGNKNHEASRGPQRLMVVPTATVIQKRVVAEDSCSGD